MSTETPPGARRPAAGEPQAHASSPERIDWSQLWYPGPRRVFTAAELSRAGAQAPSRTLTVMATINASLVGFALLQAAPPQATARLTALFAGLLVFAAVAARQLWDRPERKRLTLWTLVYSLAVLLLAAGLRWRVDDPELRRWAFGLCWGTAVLVTVVLWFLAVYRSDQIAARLRELDERDRAVAMARQLATAQIRPHFLFNSLASLQHWVQTRDERAASLLEALTGFLRATLPLFERSQLKIADELEAARHYLQVMQLRLGERLRWTVRIDPRAAGIEVPPGLLLTLVENAVEHGVQASLRGATVGVAVELQGSRLRIDVIDDGPGPGRSAADGVGLSNTRARLAQAFGPAATLVLQPRAEGGCLARIEIPSPNPAPSPP